MKKVTTIEQEFAKSIDGIKCGVDKIIVEDPKLVANEAVMNFTVEMKLNLYCNELGYCHSFEFSLHQNDNQKE